MLESEHAQVAGHPFFSSKHDLERPESKRAETKEAYAKAKSRLTSLLVELKIVPPPEDAVPEEGKEEPKEHGPSSWEAGSTS